MGQFDGRVVIVTGSSNGIGRATAQLFAREGAMVTICGRDKDTLNESKNLVLAENGNAEEKVLVVGGDICDVEIIQRTIEETVKKFGRLDILVNNAGGTGAEKKAGSELEGDLGGFDQVMDLNMKSVLRLCQLAYPYLIQTKGEIVNVSSIAGLPNGASPCFPFYCIAKAAQDQFTRSLAIHYISKGVRVNSVSPGAISTNIMQKGGLTEEMVKKSEELTTAEPSRIPYQCIGKPEEVAEAIIFLADRKRSNYIVGHQLVIDGGSSLQMPLIADTPKIAATSMATMLNKK